MRKSVLATLACALLLSQVPASASTLGADAPAGSGTLDLALRDPSKYQHDVLADGTLRFAAIVLFGVPPGPVEQARLEDAGLLVLHPFTYLSGYGVLGVPDALKTAARLPGVVLVEPVPVFVPALDVSARAVQARASGVYPSAESLGYCGRGVAIAILDTGVDNLHESLTGSYVAGVDVSNTMPLATLPPLNEVDPMDDNLAVGSVATDASSASVSVGLSHGTHVAGTALGTGGLSGIHQGVAPCAKLVDVKVLSGSGYGVSFSANEMVQNPFGVYAGLEWVLDYNAGKTRYGNPGADRVRVVNMSLTDLCGTSSSSSALDALVDTVVAHGIVVVAAAGNCGADGSIVSPGRSARAITVGAVDDHGTISRSDDTRAGFSSTRDAFQTARDLQKPDLVAPGVAIVAPRASFYTSAAGLVAQAPPPAGGTATGLMCFLLCPLGSYEKAAANALGTSFPVAAVRNDGYHPLSGTSMAAPHVTGVVALLLEKSPDLTPEQVKTALTSTASSASLWTPGLGYGEVNAYAALGAAGTGAGVPPAVSIVKPAQGNRAWAGAASFVGASTCAGQLEIFARANSGSLASVQLRIDDEPPIEIKNALVDGYYTHADWDANAHRVRVTALDTKGSRSETNRQFAACTALPGEGPHLWTDGTETFLAHLRPGASAGVVSPSGKVLSVVYQPPVEYNYSVVATLRFDGNATGRVSYDATMTTPPEYFQVVGDPLVGEPLDASWLLKGGHSFAGAASGFQARIGGKVFDHVARGETCFGALRSANSEPIEGQGSRHGDGYWAGDQVSYVKLWNWHKSGNRYDTGCDPNKRPALGALEFEESPQHLKVFYDVSTFPGGP